MILIEMRYWESRKDIVYMVSTAQESRSKCHVMRQFLAELSLGNVECRCPALMLSLQERWELVSEPFL